MRLMLTLMLCWSCFANAQAWPTKPVRIVAAYPPGGGIDVMARQLADKLTPAWGQPVVAENKPGANTIGGARRSPLLPQVPTFTELGYPEVETHAWFGLFLPAGSPREAAARIYQDTKKILDEPEFRQKQLIERGYEVVGSSPEEFIAYM